MIVIKGLTPCLVVHELFLQNRCGDFAALLDELIQTSHCIYIDRGLYGESPGGLVAYSTSAGLSGVCYLVQAACQ